MVFQSYFFKRRHGLWAAHGLIAKFKNFNEKDTKLYISNVEITEITLTQICSCFILEINIK